MAYYKATTKGKIATGGNSMNTSMTKIIGVILTTIILVASFGNLKSFAAGKTCSFWEELTEGDEYMKCPLPE